MRTIFFQLVQSVGKANEQRVAVGDIRVRTLDEARVWKLCLQPGLLLLQRFEDTRRRGGVRVGESCLVDVEEGAIRRAVDNLGSPVSVTKLKLNRAAEEVAALVLFRFDQDIGLLGLLPPQRDDWLLEPEDAPTVAVHEPGVHTQRGGSQSETQHCPPLRSTENLHIPAPYWHLPPAPLSPLCCQSRCRVHLFCLGLGTPRVLAAS